MGFFRSVRYGFKYYPYRKYIVNLLERNILGEHQNDDFGRGVSAIGDINRDGLEDFAVSAIQNDDAANDAGIVYIFSGRDAYDSTGATIDLEEGQSITGFPVVAGSFGTNIGSYLSASSRGFTQWADIGWD